MIMIFILGLPLLLALGGFHRRLRPLLVSLAPWSALPALVWALGNPPHSVFEVPWLFIGIHLGLDDVGRSVIIVTALVWMLAGISARESFVSGATSHRVFIVYLVTLTGMFGLSLAQDLPTFTLFYALLTFAAYGLIIVEQTVTAHRAGLAYLILAVVGEILLLEAVLHIMFIAGNHNISQIPAVVATASERHLIIGLLLAGFGIKIGVFPLHVWIPMAYSATPIAISAVLSGSMFMAGFLGWMRLLPLGMIALPEWGLVCMIAGTMTLLYGIGIGLTQKNAKTLLAYSTISQAGLLTTGFGMGMVMPDQWSHIAKLMVLWPMHHAIAMGSLFLGLGVAGKTAGTVWQHQLVAVGLVVSALALIGVPISSGALNKGIFEITALPMTSWTALLSWLPALGTLGMSLLMGRFLIEAWPWRQDKGIQPEKRLTMGVWLPWIALLVCDGLMMWVMRLTLSAETESLLWSPMAIMANLWPIVIGGLFIWGMIRMFDDFPTFSVPPGDLVVGIERLANRTQAGWKGITGETWQAWRRDLASHPLLHKSRSLVSSIIEEMEGALSQWMTLGATFLFLVAMFFFLLLAT